MLSSLAIGGAQNFTGAAPPSAGNRGFAFVSHPTTASPILAGSAPVKKTIGIVMRDLSKGLRLTCALPSLTGPGDHVAMATLRSAQNRHTARAIKTSTTTTMPMQPGQCAVFQISPGSTPPKLPPT